MNMFAIQVLAEIGVVLLICYGIWHEEDLIEFETVMKQYIKKKWRHIWNSRKYSMK